MSANSFGGFAAEFPHDNPELFAGPGWLALEPCAPARAIGPASSERPHYPDATPENDAQLRVVESEASQVPDDAAGGPPVAACQETDLDRFVSIVVGLVRESGGELAAMELERFLQGGEFAIDRLPLAARRTLVTGRFAPEPSGDLSEATRQTRDAWQSVLGGDGMGLGDLCESTLDEWAAGLAGACLGLDASERDRLRRGLRARGVLAFGMRAPA